MKTKLYNSYIYLHLPRTFIEFLKHKKYLRKYIKIFISNNALKNKTSCTDFDLSYIYFLHKTAPNIVCTTHKLIHIHTPIITLF